MHIIKFLQNNYLILLICLIPLSLIAGPFIAELNIFIIIVLTFVNYSKINLEKLLSKEIIFLIFFYIFLIINSIFSDYTLHSLKSSVPYFRFILYSICIFIVLCETKTKEINFFKLLIVYALLFLSFDGIYQFQFGYNLFLMQDTSSSKISGLFGNEKILGSYLVRFLPFVIFILMDTKRKYLNIYICSLIIVATILLTGERSPILLLIVIIFFSTVYFLKYINTSRLILSILSIFFLIVPFIFNDLKLKERYIDLSISQLKKIDINFKAKTNYNETQEF